MATVHPEGSDPRAFAHLDETSVKPVVALPRNGAPLWMMGAGVVLAGILLFTVLDARRRALTAPSTQIRAVDSLGTPSPPPTLFVPPAEQPVIVAPITEAPPAPPPPAPPPAPPPPQIVYVPQPAPAVPLPPPPPPRASNEPALVVDTGTPGPAPAAANAPPPPAAENAATDAALSSGGRTRAGMFANRATTVAQGTLIPAVLETALDSTRPGFARAIVSRDVRGFDGGRVLIPRGSRLIGEYRSEVATGQHRALVNWTRLIRPDGVTIAIGSPAGDPLGRGGIAAHVNSHFFARFAGAILQSVLDIGVNLASRAGSGTVIYALPGTLQGTAQIVQPSQVTPTLTVRQGTSISIFAARDLDFTGTENRR